MAPSVSKSLLTQELLGCAWVDSVKQLAQLVRGQRSDFRLKMAETGGTVFEKMRIGGNMSMNACARKGRGWECDKTTL